MRHAMKTAGIMFVASIALAGSAAQAQVNRPLAPLAQPTVANATEHVAAPPPGYLIGPEDVLHVVFWRDADMSADVVVRPDGMITLPLVNDVQAAGLTPSELGTRLATAASRFFDQPNVTVIVRQINSRKVFITGEVSKPGEYPLTSPTTVLQVIAMAGGLKDYADAKNIVVMRKDRASTKTFRFNYKDVSNHKRLEQDLELKPGDTIVVP